MATIIYKKFIKPAMQQRAAQKQAEKHESPISHESPAQLQPQTESQLRTCNHQRKAIKPSDTNLPADQEKNAHRVIDKEFSSDGDDSCEVCRYEKKALSQYRWKLIIGLFFPWVIQALDTTIIAGALTFIASDFHQLTQLNWIISAFKLTSATFIPFWAQYADIFGRYVAIQTATVVMLLGSILCSAAPVTSFAMLLVGRALQGIGCAGLLIITKVVLADKVSLKENAKNNTVFTVVAGVGYGIGPVVGGYLTEASWRWCFIINIPLGVIALVLAHFILRKELLGPQKVTRTDGATDIDVPQNLAARIATIDLGGQFLFLFGTGLIVLALTWAGAYYPWADVKVIVPLVIGCVLFSAFVVWEILMVPGGALSMRFPTQKAMIPWDLVWTRNAGILIYINFVTGMAMYAVFYFAGIYFAVVQQFTAGKSGTNLLYYVPGLAGGAYLAMFACNRWPLQTFAPLLLGTIIEPLGITLLAIAFNGNNLSFIYGMLALTGIGTGIRLMPGTLHGVAYFPKQIANIVSMMLLANSFGGTIATTLMLNIFNNTLRTSGVSFSGADTSSFDAIDGMSAAQQAFFRDRAKRGIVLAFYAVTAFCWLGVLACGALGNVRIGRKGRADEICRGSYIGSLLWNRGREEKAVEEGGVRERGVHEAAQQ